MSLWKNYKPTPDPSKEGNKQNQARAGSSAPGRGQGWVCQAQIGPLAFHFSVFNFFPST